MVKNRTLLIVDDEVDLCQMLAWDFEDFGMTVYRAHGAWEALELLNREQIDFVLSDVQMSQGDGLELVAGINQQNFNLAGIFLMSGQAQFLDSDKFNQMGISNVIKKPINTEKIIQLFLNYIPT